MLYTNTRCTYDIKKMLRLLQKDVLHKKGVRTTAKRCSIYSKKMFNLLHLVVVLTSFWSSTSLVHLIKPHNKKLCGLHLFICSAASAVLFCAVRCTLFRNYWTCSAWIVSKVSRQPFRRVFFMILPQLLHDAQHAQSLFLEWIICWFFGPIPSPIFTVFPGSDLVWF